MGTHDATGDFLMGKIGTSGDFPWEKIGTTVYLEFL